MPHFLVKLKCINGDTLSVLDPETLKHLAALRVKPGERVKFIDQNKMQYLCEVIEVSKKCVRVHILDIYESNRKLGFGLYLAQSVLKHEAQDLTIANAVQLGVRGIYPVVSDNSTVSVNVARKKIERWQKNAYESFKQCERADLPKVYDIASFKEIFSDFKESNIIVFAEKNADTTLKEALGKVDRNEKILAVIGPEGGFSDSEFEFFKQRGYSLVGLGNLILKAPNAVSVGLGNIIYELG